MDKSWMKIKDRMDERYELGVDKFLEFAYKNIDESAEIACPCISCNNMLNYSKDLVRNHLRIRGIRSSHVKWVYHGELREDRKNADHVPEEEDNDDDDELEEMLNDVRQATLGDDWISDDIDQGDIGEAADPIMRLLEDAKEELYPGCEKYTKLSFIVTLLHMKTLYGWTNNSFDALLGVFMKALPVEASVPPSFYEAKKIIRNLGFTYEKIHACVNDCVLYRKQYASLDTCPNKKCKQSRYKPNSKVPRKVLRYFPLKSRLQIFFMNKEVASDMRWHKEKRETQDENVMRHPADSEAWKHFDMIYPDFAADARNIRLGLASDGFQPFEMTNYTIWPVFLVPYNLPPWKCMKNQYSIMSMLIPGPKSPGNDIDVYLQPLIDDLNELWNGVEAYDAFKSEKFTLRASLLWTINDFPVYAMLSGWSTKGYSACPICMQHTTCMYLKHSRKVCYMGHRRFLPKNHRWRKDKKAFDGAIDNKDPVSPMSGREVLSGLNSLEIDFCEFGKGQLPLEIEQRKRKRQPVQKSKDGMKWSKKSVFFELPYWSDLKLRHNIDIMHVVKNVAESLVGTILDVKGKTKDTVNARKDLMELQLKKDSHLQENGDSYIMPMGSYHLTKVEKEKVVDFISSIKFPDGFASNISRCIKGGELQLSGMKSHDFHIFLQRVLPVAIRGCLTKEVREVIYALSAFITILCTKTSYRDVLEAEEQNIAFILCRMEKLFPPSFFDIMEHLLVHLPLETKIAGPSQFRWMYPIERKMGGMKGDINNNARPEGCIAERHIAKECLTFCSMYLNDVDTSFNKVERNNDTPSAGTQYDVFSYTGRPFGAATFGSLSESELAKIHACVLDCCTEVDQYVVKHKEKLKRESSMNIDQRHDKEFPSWFSQQVLSSSNTCDDELRSLAKGLG